MWFDDLKKTPPDERLAAIQALPATLTIWASKDCEYKYLGQTYRLRRGKNTVKRNFAAWLMLKGKPYISDHAPQRSGDKEKGKNVGSGQHNDLGRGTGEL